MPLSVYYLDDEFSLCENFVDYFASDEINVITFTDPKTAVEAIKKKLPDLFFVDYRLPGTTGDEVAQAVGASIPIYLITGDLEVKTEYKFIAVFGKPCPEGAIAEILIKHLKLRTAPQSISL